MDHSTSGRRLFLLVLVLVWSMFRPEARAEPASPAIAIIAALPKSFDPRTELPAANISEFKKVRTDRSIPPEWLKPPTDPYVVGPGDQLEIELMEFPETRQVCMVLPDGRLFFHILEGLKVTGLNLDQIKNQLQKALAANYHDPEISIILRVATNRKIWMLGRCKQPGVYPLEGPTTVLEAIARAGGFDIARSLGDTEEIVDLAHAFLVRNGRFVPIDFTKLVREGDTTQNIYLQNNDSIFLPSASGARTYVMGAVNNPLVVDFRDTLSLSAALANAGGLAPGAYPQRVVIIRDSLTNPRVAVVNFSEIMHGKARDIALEPKDIVWVPNSPFQRVAGYLGLIVNTFARTVAADQGIRIAAPNQQPVGVNISVGGVSSAGTISGAGGASTGGGDTP
jgi:polysaccharide export outer membrane protein